MEPPPPFQRMRDELAQATKARLAGLEGRARVCARRAAGWAAGEYYERVVGAKPPASALALLKWVAERPELATELHHAAQRLTTHVTHEHVPPFPNDPLDDAQFIVDSLRAMLS